MQFDRFNGGGKNTIDRSDLTLLGGASKDAAGEFVAHAALEAYSSAPFESAPEADLYDPNHSYANLYFGQVEPGERVPIFSTEPGAASRYTQTISSRSLGESFTITVVTPQPYVNSGKIVSVDKNP